MKKVTLLFLILIAAGRLNAQTGSSLSARQKSIVSVAALTAKGDLPALKIALVDGLGAGLTVNEVKEMMVHLYAYCGFPRSLNGINTFMIVLNERKNKGIKDMEGSSPSPVKAKNKYAIGKANLDKLTGRVANGPATGYAAFLPAIDTLLKEHLFADIFERGVLTSQERELITVSALTSLGGVESQLSGHLAIALRNGLTKQQLSEMLAIQETTIGRTEAEAGRNVLNKITTRTE